MAVSLTDGEGIGVIGDTVGSRRYGGTTPTACCLPPANQSTSFIFLMKFASTPWMRIFTSFSSGTFL